MSGIASKEQRHALKDRKDDFYATPIEAVRALIAVEGMYMPRRLLEPACGDGAIMLPLRAAGYDVVASDLVPRGCPDSTWGNDFMMPFPVPPGIEGVVTNPPFKLAQPFIEKALTLAPYVAILARLAFLESERRMDWFRNSGLARVHVSSRRLPMMHRDGWDGPLSTSATAFAWFVWDRRHPPGFNPELRWFDWKRVPGAGG